MNEVTYPMGYRIRTSEVRLTRLPPARIGVLGPNGGGKTTLLRSLHGSGARIAA
jgi:ATPase subunit of ABC transporter with duplicated ATPase domains